MSKTHRNPGKIISFYLVVLLISMMFFGILTSAAATEPISAAFVQNEITDSKKVYSTVSGDKVWKLVLEVTIETDTSGKYIIYGDMMPSGIDNQATTGTIRLEAGRNTVELKFEGERIYQSEIDGRYMILITLEHELLQLDSFYYTTTGVYDHNDFKPIGKPMSEYTIGLQSNTVKLQTDVLTAVIHETDPVIEYYYTGDNGEAAKFRVTYKNLIGYDDTNENGIYDSSDETIYTADLFNANWISNKVLMENFESFDFEIFSTVTLQSSINPNVNAIVSFHYSSASYTTSSVRKFDIYIELLDDQVLKDVDAIAIEHTLTDESSNPNQHTFEFDQSNHRIRFINNADGLQHGFYSWMASADSNNQVGDIAVTAVTRPDTTAGKNGIKLILSYKYDDSIYSIFHDPEIGIDGNNIGGFIETAQKILHNPAIYIVSALVAGVIVMVSLFRPRKK